jgi:hypothetical protein
MTAFPALMNRILSAALLLTLAACKARDIPRSDAPWITLGASNDVVTSLDTSRIVVEPATRVVWVRQLTAIRAEPKGPVTRMTRAESRHRINCGTRVVTDLEPAGATRPFAEHPHGKRVFATVCNALGNLPAKR